MPETPVPGIFRRDQTYLYFSFMIQQKKTDYESPTTAILDLRVEGFICQSIPGSTINPFENDGDPITF